MDMQKMFSLEGKVALVTGAAYGIGFAMAEALAGPAVFLSSDASNFVNGHIL